MTDVVHNLWGHMNCAQHAAHNPKLKKMGLFRHRCCGIYMYIDQRTHPHGWRWPPPRKWNPNQSTIMCECADIEIPGPGHQQAQFWPRRYWSPSKMDNILQTTFSNAFFWKLLYFHLKSQLLLVQWWLVTSSVPSHYLNKWWLIVNWTLYQQTSVWFQSKYNSI